MVHYRPPEDRAAPQQRAGSGDYGTRAGPPDEWVADRQHGCNLARCVFLVEEEYGAHHKRPAPPGRRLIVGNRPGDVLQGLAVPLNHIRERVVFVKVPTGPGRVDDLSNEDYGEIDDHRYP